MRNLTRSLWFLLMVPGLAHGQTALRSGDSSANKADVATQLDALREALLQTQQQVAAQQQEIQTLKAQLKGSQSGTVGAALIPAAEVVRSNPTPPNVNPSDVSPEVHNGIANAVSRSADQDLQEDERFARVHQSRRRRADPGRIRRFREYLSDHKHSEQHRHQFRRHTFQQHCSGKCH